MAQVSRFSTRRKSPPGVTLADPDPPVLEATRAAY